MVCCFPSQFYSNCSPWEAVSSRQHPFFVNEGSSTEVAPRSLQTDLPGPAAFRGRLSSNNLGVERRPTAHYRETDDKNTEWAMLGPPWITTEVSVCRIITFNCGLKIMILGVCWEALKITRGETIILFHYWSRCFYVSTCSLKWWVHKFPSVS